MLNKLYNTLGGSARAYDPLTAGYYPELIILENVQTKSKKGNDMIRTTVRDKNSGREATFYTMEWKQDQWDAIARFERLDVISATVGLENGFYSISEPTSTGVHLLELPELEKVHSDFIVYDLEVFRYHFIFCGENLQTGERTCIVDDLDSMRQWYLRNRNNCLIGYNSASYDNNVLRGYLQGADPFQLNNAIIKSDDRSLVYKLYNTKKTPIIGLDLYHEAKMYSLKEFEVFYGLDVRETAVKFDIDRPLTKEELQEEIDYCWQDVYATKVRFKALENTYLAKAFICAMFKLDKRAMCQTNANLVAQLMGAERVERFDWFDEWQIPENIHIENEDVRKMFEGHRFEVNSKGKPKAGGDWVDPVTGYGLKFGAGGLHGALGQLIHIGRWIQADGASLYPNIYILFDVLSRNVPPENKHLVEELLAKRIEAKYSNESTTTINGVEIPMWVLVDGIKLPINTLFGATGAEFNGLADIRNQFLTCVIGQCIFFDLYEKLVPHIEVMLQTNTDAHSFIPKDDQACRDAIADVSKRTGIKFDYDEFNVLYQKDVSNYIAIDAKGKVKIKGSLTLNHGTKNSMRIVSNAFINYVVCGKDYKEYIRECEDVIEFQIATKTSRKFDRTCLIVDGEEYEAQKVNRVFATKTHGGDLYKVKHGAIDWDEEEAKFVKGEDSYCVSIPNAPEAYTISNEAIGQGITIDEIDKEYYIGEVERHLTLWFGENWKERVEDSWEQREMNFEVRKWV